MKKNSTKISFLTIFAILLLSQTSIFAQRTVQVPQGVGTLNEAINSDTTSSGERVDLNTIYELTLGGYYVLTGSLENSGYPLTIVAEEGEGTKPILRPGVVDGESSRAFRIRDDLTLRGIYVSNLDEQNGLNKNLIRASADDITIIIDNCHLDYDSQSALRIDDSGMKIYITNSIISNIGTMASPDNGRGIDDRGNDIEILVLENNTFYNITSKVLRDGGGIINECKVNHNSVINIAQSGISVGEAINVEFTNNLIYNAGFLGKRNSTFEDNEEVFAIDPLGDDLIASGIEQQVKIKYNNIFVSPELYSSYPDSIVAVALYDSLSTIVMGKTGTSSSNFSENVSFITAPTIPTSVISASWDDNVDPKIEMDNGDGGPEYGGVQTPFDFSYNTNAISYKSAQYGQPLGDLHYFNMEIINNSDARIVEVTQGVGTLNEAINSDTLANGERVDVNTIYQLSLGGYYVLTGSLENSGYPLTIVAEEGEGTRPILRPGVVDGESSRAFRIRDDLTLRGLYVSNLDEQNGLNKNLIRASADDITITIDNCHLDYDSQSALRIDDGGMKIYITNSIISNVGTMASPDNGRAIDDRGNDIDVLVLENNTFYNITSRVLRDGGGIINFSRVNHNTLSNIAQRGFTFGEVINAEFTNNMIANAGFLGMANGAEIEILEVDPLGDDLVGEGYVQTVKISNNNFFVSDEYSSVYPDSVIAVPMFDSLASILMDPETNIIEQISFSAPPSVDVSVVTGSWDKNVDPKPEMDAGGGSPDFGGVQMPFDYSYSTETASYVLAKNGLPVGDLNYFDVISDVEDSETEVIPNEFELSQNYPNPFNPSTNISYNIPKAGNVSLVVYNLLGQKVTTLVNKELSAGKYSIVWNGVNDFGRKVVSGIYIYQLITNDFTASKKMMLLK